MDLERVDEPSVHEAYRASWLSRSPAWISFGVPFTAGPGYPHGAPAHDFEEDGLSEEKAASQAAYAIVLDREPDWAPA